MSETSATETLASKFWQFNIGNVTVLFTLLLTMIGIWTTGIRQFDNHESRIASTERAETLLATAPGKIIVLETRVDILQAQINQLSMATNRTSDAIVGMREDIASIKASLAARGN